jgi:hypothetical protein
MDPAANSSVLSKHHSKISLSFCLSLFGEGERERERERETKKKKQKKSKMVERQNNSRQARWSSTVLTMDVEDK